MAPTVAADVRQGDIVLVPFLVPFKPDDSIYLRATHANLPLPILPEPGSYDHSTSPASILRTHLHGPAMIMSVLPPSKRDYPTDRELLRFPYWLDYDPENPPRSINVKPPSDTARDADIDSSRSDFQDVHVVVRLLSHPHLSYPVPLDRLIPWSAVRFDKHNGVQVLEQCLSIRKELEAIGSLTSTASEEDRVGQDPGVESKRDALEASFLLHRAWTIASSMSLWAARCPHRLDRDISRLARLSGGTISSETEWEEALGSVSHAVYVNNTVLQAGDHVIVRRSGSAGLGHLRVSHFTSSRTGDSPAIISVHGQYRSQVGAEAVTTDGVEEDMDEGALKDAVTLESIDSKCYSSRFRNRPDLGADARRPLRLYNTDWASSNLNVYRQYETMLAETMRNRVEDMGSDFKQDRKKSSKKFTAVYFVPHIEPHLLYCQAMENVDRRIS